jgi:hypothetical protein
MKIKDSQLKFQSASRGKQFELFLDMPALFLVCCSDLHFPSSAEIARPQENG